MLYLFLIYYVSSLLTNSLCTSFHLYFSKSSSPQHTLFYINLTTTQVYFSSLALTSSLPLTRHILVSSSGDVQTRRCCSARSCMLKLKTVFLQREKQENKAKSVKIYKIRNSVCEKINSSLGPTCGFVNENIN